MELESWDSAKDGPFSEEKLKRRLELLGYRVSRYVYSPGTYFPDHKHSVDKIDAVVSGRFRMKMKNLEVILEAGDWLQVPAGTIHSAEVVGEGSVISLDAVRI